MLMLLPPMRYMNSFGFLEISGQWVDGGSVICGCSVVVPIDFLIMPLTR